MHPPATGSCRGRLPPAASDGTHVHPGFFFALSRIIKNKNLAWLRQSRGKQSLLCLSVSRTHWHIDCITGVGLRKRPDDIISTGN